MERYLVETMGKLQELPGERRAEVQFSRDKWLRGIEVIYPGPKENRAI